MIRYDTYLAICEGGRIGRGRCIPTVLGGLIYCIRGRFIYSQYILVSYSHSQTKTSC